MVNSLTSDKSTKTNIAPKFFTPLLLTFLFLSAQLFAQIPAGYYDAASGKSGEQLKAALNDIISGHTSYPYSSSSTDVWDILKDADRDPNNSANVIGIYSGFSMDAAAEYAGGSGWNREHVWAKSRGDFGTSQGAGTDCHHLRAADISTNSARNNRNFDYADEFYIDASGTYNGPTESKTSSSSYVWEPRDEVKGDIARMIFYMATRYEGENGEPDLELTETLLDNADKSPVHAKLSVLLEWHQLDPVSDAERTRNDVIYSYQNNRNPYIDHPEYVCLIYACSGSGGNTAPDFSSTPITSNTEGQVYQYTIETNDAEGDPISISATTLPSWLSFTDNGNGTALISGTSSTADIGEHPVEITITDGSLSNIQNFTITVSPQGGGNSEFATDLIISEYIEGASYNKGLEIANFTGSSVDLSSYSIFKQTNGSGAWSSELSLTGTLADGEVYVIVHTSAAAAMQAEADLVTGVGALTFNGNDPIALFKNGELLDVVGFFNSTANFAQDQTLIRKSTITSPSTTYDESEWDFLASDTFENLGSHTMNLSTGTDTEAPSAPQGLSVADVTSTSFTVNWTASTDNVGVNAYEVFVDGNSVGIVGGLTYSFSGMSAATTYLIQLKAIDAAGNSSALSSNLSVTTANPTDTEAPTVPTALVAENISFDGFTLSWSASSDNTAVVGYKVRLDGALIGSTTATTYEVTELNPQTSYQATVSAYDAEGNESASATPITINTIEEPDTEAPSAPANLVAAAITTTSFTLSWDAATDNIAVEAYEVYLNGALETTTSNTNYNLSGLLAGTAYLTYVVAVDAAGNKSTASLTLQTTTAQDPDTEAPSAPGNFSVTSVGQTDISIAWDAATDNRGVISYKVYLDGNLVYTDNVLSYTFLGLQESTSYTLAVSAFDAAGNESSQSSLVATTSSTQQPQTVLLSESYFETGWDDWISGGRYASYYTGSFAFEGNHAIRINDDNGLASSMASIAMDVNNFNQLSFEFYFYSNRMDYGDQFEVAYFDGTNWNTLARYTEGIDFEDRGFYTATINIDRAFYNFPLNAQFRIQGFADNRRDELYFDQITIHGLSSDSALRTTRDGVYTTIEKVGGEVTVNSLVKTYPNPVLDGYLHVQKEYETEGTINIKLIDLKGNVIYQSSDSVNVGLFHKVIDTSTLSSGIYFIQFNDEEGALRTEKVIIR